MIGETIGIILMFIGIAAFIVSMALDAQIKTVMRVSIVTMALMAIGYILILLDYGGIL